MCYNKEGREMHSAIYRLLMGGEAMEGRRRNAEKGAWKREEKKKKDMKQKLTMAS